MKAKMLLTSLVAGLALFLATAGIASADDPDDSHGHNSAHHDGYDFDRDDHDFDHHDFDRDDHNMYCWAGYGCSQGAFDGSFVIIYILVPYGYCYPTPQVGTSPGYVYGGINWGYPWLPTPGMGY